MSRGSTTTIGRRTQRVYRTGDMVRRDERFGAAIQRALVAVAPAADGVLKPKWFEGSDDEPALLGVSVAETRAFALTALERRLKAIGLAVAA